MLKFRFVVLDESGRRRKGTLQANRLEEARKRLLQAGFEIVSLVADGQPLDLGDAEPGELHLPVSRRWLGVAALLACLGLLGLALAWLKGSPPAFKPQPLKFTLQGSCSAPSGSVVVLDMPEMPLRMEKPASANFRFEVSIESFQQPTYAWVAVQPARGRRADNLGPEGLESRYRKRVALRRDQVRYEVGQLSLGARP